MHPRRRKSAIDHYDGAREQATPVCLAFFNDAELHGVTGFAFQHLAAHDRLAARKAEPLLLQAISGRGPQYGRSRTLNLIGLSAVHFAGADNIEEGVRVGDEALADVDTLHSRRALTRLRRLAAVAERYNDVPDVAAFRERVHLAIAAYE